MSTFQVARITGVSHHASLFSFLKMALCSPTTHLSSLCSSTQDSSLLCYQVMPVEASIPEEGLHSLSTNEHSATQPFVLVWQSGLYSNVTIISYGEIKPHFSLHIFCTGSSEWEISGVADCLGIRIFCCLDTSGTAELWGLPCWKFGFLRTTMIGWRLSTWANWNQWRLLLRFLG
jgi:hypothetical protein